MTTHAASLVTETTAANPLEAARHFAELLTFETDCWDVHQSLSNGTKDFVLLDVRGAGGFNSGHIDGAIHFPHRNLTADALARFAMNTVFVVYCAGPHCNGADKAALRLAALDRPVKKMIGGITGWKDEGFDLVLA
jgi:rhodanese-related sulfurtransferase